MTAAQIGRNIRGLRLASGLTVAALAERAGLTKGGMSKIETGRTSSPISTLVRVAAGLNVPLARMFVEPEVTPPFVLTRDGQGKQIARDGGEFGYSYVALALTMPRKLIEPFILTVSPGDPVGRFQHGGQEFIYMLSGRLAITVADQALELRPGDSLYFDPTHVHTTRAAGKVPAKFLCVFIQDQPAPALRPAQINRRHK